MQSPVPQQGMAETSSQSHLSPRFRTENVLSTPSLPISTSSLLLAWPQTQVCEFLYLSLGRGACYFTYTKFCQVWLIFHLSFQIWKITDLFLYSKDRNPSHLAALMFHTQNWNAMWACVRIYFCRPWICSVHSSWLLQWMKQITILIHIWQIVFQWLYSPFHSQMPFVQQLCIFL